MNKHVGMMAGWLLAAGVAQAELVLIAHPGTDPGPLTSAQVGRIFLGQTDRLPNGSKVTPLNVNGESRDAFIREVLGKTPQQVEKYWARMIFTGKATPPSDVAASEVRQVVARTPGALSYLDKSQVDASVKVVTVVAN